MHRDGAGKADQFPPRLVAVAAVDRVGEHSFHHGLIERGPEYACGRTIVENELAGRKRNEHLFALQRVEEVEGLAVGFAAMSVGRLDAGAVKLRRRERQLIALARHAQFPRTLHVESLALAPAARKRAIDVDVDPDIGAFGGEFVGRHHVIHERLDKGRFREIQERVTGGGWFRRPLLLRLRALGQMGRSRGRTADNGAFEKIAPAQASFAHLDSLPFDGGGIFCLILGSKCLFPAVPASRWRALSFCARQILLGDEGAHVRRVRQPPHVDKRTRELAQRT